MRRREFLAVLGGAAALPLTAHAQQPPSGKWRIGFLMFESRQKQLRDALRDLGYVEGQNLTIEARTNERGDLLAGFAAEFVAMKLDVIVTNGTQAARAAQQATASIPIVMTSSDPVGAGLVPNLARPGANITGLSLFSPEVSGKRLQLLREVTGGLSSVAVLWNPEGPPAADALKQTQAAASAMGLETTAVEARVVEDFTPAFAAIAKSRANALVILAAPLMTSQAARLATLALGSKLPSIFVDRKFPEGRGLMSYGPDFDAHHKRLAIYVDKILKGARPADLPVEQPTKFELILNRKTAEALGLTIPPSLLALADEVIE